MCCSCEGGQTMMLLRHSTLCIPFNQTGQDNRLSNQAELLPLSFTCKQKLFGCFREKCQISCEKITGSGKLRRRKHSILPENSQVPDRETCWEKVSQGINWRDDPLVAQVYWNILCPIAVGDHQSSFNTNIHATARYSTYI